MEEEGGEGELGIKSLIISNKRIMVESGAFKIFFTIKKDDKEGRNLRPIELLKQWEEMWIKSREELSYIDEKLIENENEYRKRDYSNKLNKEIDRMVIEECVVCKDDINNGEKIVSLPKCRHILHRGCIERWFKEGSMELECPICRESYVDNIGIGKNMYIRMLSDEEYTDEEFSEYDSDESHECVCGQCYSSDSSE